MVSRVFLLLLMSCLPAVGIPTVPIVRTAVPPVIDGQLNDRCWQNASKVTGFRKLGTKELAKEQTFAFLCRDDTHLYAAFRAMESQTGKLKTEIRNHDGPVWRDDCIELLLDTHHDHEYCRHLVINTAGVTYEDIRRPGCALDPSWNPEIKTGITRGSSQWMIELAIPFKELGGVPKDGATWGIGIGRHSTPARELSSWNRVYSSFVELEQFGHGVFHPFAPALRSAPVGQASFGPNKCDVELAGGLRGGSVRLELITQEGESRKLPVSLPIRLSPGQKQTASLSYSLCDGGDGAVFLRMTDSKGALLGQIEMPFQFPPVGSQLTSALALLEKTKPLIPPTGKHRRDFLLLEEELTGLQEMRLQSVRQGGLPQRLVTGASACIFGARRLYAEVWSKVLNGRDDYGYGVENSLRKLPRDEPFNGQISGKMRIALAQNERESAQLVLMPFSRDLHGVRVIATDLVSGSARIPGSAITVNPVGYVRTKPIDGSTERVGWWPDPLLEKKSFDVSVGCVQPVWITVFAPEKSRPGLYRGHLIIQPANAPELRVPMEVTVFSFSLPTRPHLKTAFCYWGICGPAYRPHAADAKTYQNYSKVMLEHRISPLNLGTYFMGFNQKDFSRLKDFEETMEFCKPRGLTVFNIYFRPNASASDLEMETMKQFYNHLEKQGWADMAYAYIWDEPDPPDYSAVRSIYGQLHRNVPGLKRLITEQPIEDLFGYVDIWCPVIDMYDPAAARERQKAGEEVWWYVCVGPGHPYPNFFIDYPAIDQRVIFWMNWKYRVTGFLYYGVDLWAGNNQLSLDECIKNDYADWNPNSFANRNGDGYLLYPGPDDKPLSTVRLANIRDGIEDYEYFYLLNERVEKLRKSRVPGKEKLLAKAEKLLVVNPSVVASRTVYTLSPALLLTERVKVAKMIEEIDRILIEK